MTNYTGIYLDDENREYKIYIEDGNMMLAYRDRIFGLLIHSKEKFSTKTTAIDLTVNFDKNGKAIEMIHEFTGFKTKTIRK